MMRKVEVPVIYETRGRMFYLSSKYREWVEKTRHS